MSTNLNKFFDKFKLTKKNIITWIIAIAIVCFFAFYKFDTTISCTDKIAAAVEAESLVKERLKSPTSADFPVSESKVIIDEKANEANKNSCHFKVSGKFDAQNSFGAKIRSYYNVQMTYDKTTKKWTSNNLFIK